MLASLLTKPAFAQQPASANRVSSQVRYREAVTAFRQGKWQDARHLLLELWSESHTYDVAVTLVQTEYQLEHYAAAAGYLEFALANIPPTEKLSAAEEYKKNLLELRGRTSRVSIDTKPTAAELRVDAEPVGKSPLASAIYLDPGQHVIEARLGDLRATQTIDAPRGSELAVRLNLARDSAPPSVAAEAPPPHATQGNSSPNYAPAIVTASVGAAALISGVVLVLEAGHKDTQRDQHRSQLPGNNACGAGTPFSGECQTIHSLADDAKTFRALSFASFGVAMAAGVATYFLWPRRNDETQAGTRAAPFASATSAGAFAGILGYF